MKRKEGIIDSYIRKKTVEVFMNFEKVPNVSDWKRHIESLPISEDPFVRTLNKYKCRMFYFNFTYKIMVNLGSFLSLFKIHVLNFFELIFKKNKNNYISEDLDDYDMIIIKREVNIDDVFPEELFEEYPKYKIIESRHDRTMIYNKEMKSAYKKLARKNPFRFHLKLLALRELALHSYVLENYNPKATVVYINERNVLGPIIKNVYECMNKEFIGFMHGTDLLHLVKAYMAFSRYYIWDEEYIDMYVNDMKCDIAKYIVYKPEKLKYQYSKKAKYGKDLTYYLSATSNEALEKLAKITEELKLKQIKIKFRAHPRVPELEKIKRIIGEENFEDSAMDIIDSIDNTKYVVGLSTTVMEQAFYGNKEIILDDLTDKEMFNNLVDRKYLMLKKEHILFSEFLKKIRQNKKI